MLGKSLEIFHSYLHPIYLNYFHNFQFIHIKIWLFKITCKNNFTSITVFSLALTSLGRLVWQTIASCCRYNQSFFLISCVCLILLPRFLIKHEEIPTIYYCFHIYFYSLKKRIWNVKCSVIAYYFYYNINVLYQDFHS